MPNMSICSRRVVTLGLALGLLLTGPVVCPAAQLRVDSDTIFRAFERDTSKEEDQKVFPAYEYLRIDYGELEEDGLSFHAYAWGRHAFGDDFFDDRNAGEFLYGYAEYHQSEKNLSARLGRQYIFSGVSNETVDGLRFSSDVSPYFTLDLYGGQPVTLEEVDGRSGDRIWGGRISHHLGGHYDLGLSYKRLDNDGDRQEEVLGIDSFVYLPMGITVTGRSNRNQVIDVWQEHTYEAKIPVLGIVLQPYFQRFLYSAYFGTGDNTGPEFQFLKNTDERVTIYGADLSWGSGSSIELGGKIKHYDYAERGETALYYSGLATKHWGTVSRRPEARWAGWTATPAIPGTFCFAASSTWTVRWASCPGTPSTSTTTRTFRAKIDRSSDPSVSEPSSWKTPWR